jgi:hypothetical protein
LEDLDKSTVIPTEAVEEAKVEENTLYGSIFGRFFAQPKAKSDEGTQLTLLAEDRDVVEFNYEGDDEEKQIIDFDPTHGRPDITENRISGYIRKLLEITD